MDWDGFTKDINQPLKDAMTYLKQGNGDEAKESISYAQNNMHKYASTMDRSMASDINWQIKTTTGLLGVSANDIDKAYELATEQMHMQNLSTKLTADVTPTLDNAESNARKTGIESIVSATTAYKEVIHAAIDNTEEMITEMAEALNKLGYIEPQ